MQESEELFEVATMFGAFIKNVTNEFNRKGYELNITQYKLLHKLEKDGPQNVSELANSLHITSAAVTSITDQLFNEEYVSKVRSTKDRRVVNITITQIGKEVLDKIQNEQKDMMNDYFSKLQKEDIQHLKRIFEILNSNF